MTASQRLLHHLQGAAAACRELDAANEDDAVSLDAHGMRFTLEAFASIVECDSEPDDLHAVESGPACLVGCQGCAFTSLTAVGNARR